jgi:hypothetical protein
MQLSRKALRFVWMFFSFLTGVDSTRKNSHMALTPSSGSFKMVIFVIAVTLDRAVPATHAPLSIEVLELSNLENSNTGKLSAHFKLLDFVSDMLETITPA